MNFGRSLLGLEQTQHIEEDAEDDLAHLDKDDLYEALSSSRRRYVIDQVGSMSRDDKTTLSDLAVGLAFVENDHIDDFADVRTGDRKRYYVSLYQNHLPAMRDAGLIEWDERSHDVRPTEATQLLFQVMTAVNCELSKRGVSV